MAYVQVPPDGAGKKVYTKTQTVNATSVEAQVIHIADNTNPEYLLSVDARGAAAVRFAEGQPILSGFGNLKVAQERALGVYESSLDTYSSLFSTQTVGTASLDYNPTESSQVLTVDGALNSSCKITTNRYHYYNPGTSNIYKMTVATGDSGKSGNTRRWGAFDDNDGLFFELQGTTFNVVVRNSTSGSVVETKVPRANFNHDKLDGLGLSGFNIDLTKINVYWIDYQWLGAGRVRFGVFADDGSRITCHQFENANQNSLPYMRSGTLPARLENVNTGITGSTSQLRNVCIGVYAEGTFEDYAFWRFADAENTIASVTTNTLAFALRTKAQINAEHNWTICYPETLNVYCDQPVAVTLWQNVAATGGTWSSLASAVDINTTATIDTSAAQRFKTIYFGAGAKAFDLDQYFEKNDEGILTNADGTPEVWAFTVTKLTASATTATLNLGYKELW